MREELERENAVDSNAKKSVEYTCPMHAQIRQMGSGDLHHLIGQQTSNWVQLLFATPVVLWAGWPFFVRAWDSLKNRSLNMFSLIALGTGVAW